MILADLLAVILEDRNTGVVFPFPVLPTVDIVDNNLEPATDKWQQLVDHYLAQVAALAAVDSQSFQSSRLSIVGRNRCRQAVCRKCQRARTRPDPSPVSAAKAAVTSPSDNV